MKSESKDRAESLLYTIRSYYENRNKTGIVLNLTAHDNTGYHTIKAYVPYRSNFEDSPKAEKLLKINSQEACARSTVFNEKKFEE